MCRRADPNPGRRWASACSAHPVADVTPNTSSPTSPPVTGSPTSATIPAVLWRVAYSLRVGMIMGIIAVVNGARVAVKSVEVLEADDVLVTNPQEDVVLVPEDGPAVLPVDLGGVHLVLELELVAPHVDSVGLQRLVAVVVRHALILALPWACDRWDTFGPGGCSSRVNRRRHRLRLHGRSGGSSPAPKHSGHAERRSHIGPTVNPQSG